MADKQKTDTPDPTQSVPGLDLTSDLATLQSMGFNRMSHFGTAWIEALSDMGSEVVSFVADRIKEDVKTQHEILHCEDMAELQHIQAKFMQRAIDQYIAETGKLVEMSQGLFLTDQKKDS